MHEQLWAPWRLAYVAAPKVEEPTPDQAPCFICRGLAQDDDRTNLIVWRRPPTVVVLNRFPYNNGHLLIAPQRHFGDLRDLTVEELLGMQQTMQELLTLLDRLMRPNGYNIGLNLGAAAGAGLPGHVHWHLVPRWIGDVNFMPVVGDVKVMVQSLDALYTLLRGEIASQPK